MNLSTETPAAVTRPDPALSLYHLLDPQVLANPYPLYHRLRTEDPVHWDPYLHAWAVTRYRDVVAVLSHFSADRTPTPEQLTAMGLAGLNPIAQVMVSQWRENLGLRGLKALPVRFGERPPLAEVVGSSVQPQKGMSS